MPISALCRGAIAIGLVHHRERIIIGPALVEAYRAEQSVVIHPRIVLDHAAADYWTEECAPTSADHLKSLVKKDDDGQNYLDIFDPQWAVFYPWTEFVSAGTDLVPPSPSQFLRAAFKRIQDGLKASGNNPDVRAKYMWLSDQCHTHAAALGMKL